MCRMCQHSTSSSLFLCAACRQTRKWAEIMSTTPLCPACRGPMRRMPYWFRTPKRKDHKAWRALALAGAQR